MPPCPPKHPQRPGRTHKMQYGICVRGRFRSRPNRFIALVDIDGRETVCHVKNTGRCRELLVPGCTVILEQAQNPDRKTPYDLIAVYKGDRLINMDSQAPNAVAAEYLAARFPGALLSREVRCEDSRLDFRLEQNGQVLYVEVKGCTLEQADIGYFPDAPTQRGVKHLHCLMRAVAAGHRAAVLFIVQMEGIRAVRPNDATHPAFGQALREAAAHGVELWAVGCRVTENTLTADSPIPVEPGFTIHGSHDTMERL